MRSAPPMAPGMPRRNDRPAMAASWAARATFTSGTAAPAHTRWPSSIATSLKPRPRRTTTPGTPPSRTMRFEPRPTTVTGTSPGRFFRKYARSSSLSGMNSACAGPPTRNQVRSASTWLGMSRPRSFGMRDLRLGVMSEKVMLRFMRVQLRASRLLHLSPRAGRGRFASGALAKRSKSGEGAIPQAQICGQAPSPGFHRSAALRSESDLSPHAGRGRASGTGAASRRLVECGEFGGQRVGPLGDIAGAEADHVVAPAHQVLDAARELKRSVERDHLAVAARADRRHQRLAVGAGDRRLAGRIDVGDDHDVGVVEAGRELHEQVVQPRVAVRLHYGDHLAVRRLARGAQHRRNLDRVMAVVVEHRDAIPLAG